MLTIDEVKSFNENGFILIRDVLSSQQIEYLRKRILNIFSTEEWKKSPFNTSQVLSDVYNVYPDLVDLTINKRVIESVKSLLGENPVLIPETAIHHKFYTGWHKDTTSQEKAKKKFHLNPDSLFLQCGFYLQDNNVLGGGLTVMEGSHKTEDNFINPKSYNLNIVERIKLKLGTYNEEFNLSLNPNKHKIIDVPSKAGDFVIFDFRLNHRATRPRNSNIEEIPFNKSKIAFFNAFARNNAASYEYLDFIKNRSEPFYQSLQNRKISTELINSGIKFDFIPL